MIFNLIGFKLLQDKSSIKIISSANNQEWNIKSLSAVRSLRCCPTGPGSVYEAD